MCVNNICQKVETVETKHLQKKKNFEIRKQIPMVFYPFFQTTTINFIPAENPLND